MPIYSSRQKVKSGVPLGGIGAGKLEILNTGEIDFFTGFNNWSQPRTGEGFGFAIRAKTAGKTSTLALRTVPFGKFKTTAHIQYAGNFPCARLDFIDGRLPVQVSLEAFSPFIPKDYKNSSLPGAAFLFKIRNPLKKSVEVSLLATGSNLSGQYEVGRYNEVRQNAKSVSVNFKLNRPLATDLTAGEFSISIPRNAGKVSYLGEWNLQDEPWTHTKEKVHFRFLPEWEKTGKLANKNTREEIASNNCRWGGALSVSVTLAPGEEKTIPVFYSWHCARGENGHRYESWFKDSVAVADYLIQNYSELHRRTKAWQNILLESALPDWLKDGLINNLYVLYSGTWWTRAGLFAMYEAPMCCPLMSTLDVRYYGSTPLALLFPELEKNELLQYIAAQRENGYVPHDLGRDRLDYPSNGTTALLWKDLNPKYILLAYRDYLWTEDRAFLKKIYPSLKKAMRFTLSTDKNRDGLPDNEGMDQTYDVWALYGTNSYISGIFLASLLALEQMAGLMNDGATQRDCRRRFLKGSQNFEKQLWNGSYFKTGASQKKSESSSMAGQLNGQWIAGLLNLSPIADPKKISQAVQSILKLNAGDSKHGATNAVFANGKRDRTNIHSQCVWPGESYVLAALAIEEGLIEQGLALARKTWYNFSDRQLNPWNQPDVIMADDGKYGFGDYYMRNMVFWAVLLAYARKDAEAGRVLEKLLDFK